MKNDNEMDRLRVARPAPPPPGDDHDARFAQIVAGPGDPRLASPMTIEKAHSVRRWMTRPRIIAGGSLGLVGVAAGLVFAFSGSTAPPAFAITRNADGTVVVHLYRLETGHAATLELNAEGIPGILNYGVWHGPAPVPGPYKCFATPWDQGQQIEILLGRDGTYVAPAGTQGAGPWHVVACGVFPNSGGSSAGTTTGSTGASTDTTGDTSTNVTTGGPSTTVTTGGPSTNGAG
jgi:hypothetical protein